MTNEVGSKRVLAVGAHPDDIEILCAGTLARYKREGWEVFMAYLCNGDTGHTEIPQKELVKIRESEAHESAKILGAHIEGGYFSDFGVFLDEKSRRIVVDLVRKAKPDVVLTHFPEDYQWDHRMTSQLVVVATFLANMPYYETDYPFHTKIPPIYYMDTLAGISFQPAEYVDISDTIEIKEKMLRCHQSQYLWLKKLGKIDYVDFMKTQSAFRGYQCGVRYAEGFIPYQAWNRVQPRRLLP